MWVEGYTEETARRCVTGLRLRICSAVIFGAGSEMEMEIDRGRAESDVKAELGINGRVDDRRRMSFHGLWARVEGARPI